MPTGSEKGNQDNGKEDDIHVIQQSEKWGIKFACTAQEDGQPLHLRLAGDLPLSGAAQLSRQALVLHWRKCGRHL